MKCLYTRGVTEYICIIRIEQIEHPERIQIRVFCSFGSCWGFFFFFESLPASGTEIPLYKTQKERKVVFVLMLSCKKWVTADCSQNSQLKKFTKQLKPTQECWGAGKGTCVLLFSVFFLGETNEQFE